jgi:hypothetical protein
MNPNYPKCMSASNPIATIPVATGLDAKHRILVRIIRSRLRGKQKIA